MGRGLRICIIIVVVVVVASRGGLELMLLVVQELGCTATTPHRRKGVTGWITEWCLIMLALLSIMITSGSSSVAITGLGRRHLLSICSMTQYSLCHRHWICFLVILRRIGGWLLLLLLLAYLLVMVIKIATATDTSLESSLMLIFHVLTCIACSKIRLGSCSSLLNNLLLLRYPTVKRITIIGHRFLGRRGQRLLSIGECLERWVAHSASICLWMATSLLAVQMLDLEALISTTALLELTLIWCLEHLRSSISWRGLCLIMNALLSSLLKVELAKTLFEVIKSCLSFLFLSCLFST